MKSITVLIVGQVRNQYVLQRSLDNLVGMKRDGLVSQIILATWSEELLKIRDLLPRLSDAGVIVTAVDEPDPAWFVPGNLMNQMRGVDLALESVDDTAWVLRARPDLLIDCELIANLAAADMALKTVEPGGALTHKIWTPCAELCQPMCLSDITYFGHYADVVKLQNFDFFHEVCRTHLQLLPGGKPITSYDAEVRKYTPAFTDSYPVLSEYYRIYNKFLLGVYEIRRSMLKMIYQEELYWQYISVYFDILEKYFLIGRDVVKNPVLLVRPQAFDQVQGLTCLNLTGCGYAGPALAPQPDLAMTIELFSAAPIYCASSIEAQSVSSHLQRIGVPLNQHLDQARRYRKDPDRIAAAQRFGEKLVGAIYGGVEIGRPKSDVWHHPFDTQFIDLI
jgi:hypothetical protein